MITLTDWLSQTLQKYGAADPFYRQRLHAFMQLTNPSFIEAQKENYKYIPLREIIGQLTAQPYPLTTVTKAGPTNHLVEGSSIVLTFINGQWSPAQSHNMPATIQLYRMADLPIEDQYKIINTYSADLYNSGDIFSILNSMLFQESYLLQFSDNSHIEPVIHIQHIVTSPTTHLTPQLLLSMGKNSQATVIEHWYRSPQIAHFINSLTHIMLSTAARLTYYTLHTEDSSFYQIHTIYCNQEADSQFSHHTFAFGAAMLRMNLISCLNGNHAVADLYGLYALSAQERVDHRVQMLHRYPHTRSRQHYKAILGGSATAVFHGTIHVVPEAQKINAYQLNNSIVLAQTAQHYVKPQLEIYADDVKCSHGATVGQLDPEQLFYVQTRGIDGELAKQLLLEAFGREVIAKVSTLDLQHYIGDKFLAKLVKL